jgi:two-component system, chemotaxis family, sensor kinase CheA
MNALHEQFILEARELIHQATEDLIAAERDGFSADWIDRVFRAFHTLKGSAGVVDLPTMSLTLHAAEDLLAAIQSGRVKTTSAVIDQALACLDQVSGWVNEFEAHETLPPEAGDDARLMADNLRDFVSGQKRAEAKEASPGTVSISELPDWVGQLIESQRGKLAQDVRVQASELFALAYEPEAGCFFNGHDPLELMRRVPKLLAFQIDQRQPWQPLVDFDPFSCNLRIQAISAATRIELSTIFRLVPDQVRIVPIPLNALPTKPSLIAGEDDDDSLVRFIITEQQRVLRAAKEEKNQAGRVGSVARVAANALRHGGRGDWTERIERAGSAAISKSSSALLMSVLEEVLQASVLNQKDILGGDTEPTAAPVASRSIRVDESRIDALLDLAGELLVMKNSLAHMAKRVEAEPGGHKFASAMRVQYNAIERLASELHAAILQLRMVPVAQIFRPFPRLVRDMSQRLNKKVALVTRGETTESDKAIVDLLFEPLMHLVRNALDHGIETSDQRRSAGKPEAATLALQASRMGDRFVVEVVDDGRGIDPSVIRRKAAERRLLPTEDLAEFSDEKALNLVFSAGFSTATEVSDISGRGVGMDVVRATIERIGGRVSLKSRVGAGTTVSIDLPANIAMLRIMVVEAGGQVFGIPMDAVSETVRLTPDRISRIKNNDGFVLHDRIVPICPLAELMNLPLKRNSEGDVRLVIVVEVGGRITALEVDAIRDRLDAVLKPMQGLLSNARGYAGTTLLGDGAVLLVLDIKEILL